MCIRDSEWTAPAILFACLVFTLTAPLLSLIHIFANETTVPEELYEYMDLGALGCRYEDEHPGVFIGSDYVCYPCLLYTSLEKPLLRYVRAQCGCAVSAYRR